MEQPFLLLTSIAKYVQHKEELAAAVHSTTGGTRYRASYKQALAAIHFADLKIAAKGSLSPHCLRFQPALRSHSFRNYLFNSADAPIETLLIGYIIVRQIAPFQLRSTLFVVNVPCRHSERPAQPPATTCANANMITGQTLATGAISVRRVLDNALPDNCHRGSAGSRKNKCPRERKTAAAFPRRLPVCLSVCENYCSFSAQ